MWLKTLHSRKNNLFSLIFIVYSKGNSRKFTCATLARAMSDKTVVAGFAVDSQDKTKASSNALCYYNTWLTHLLSDFLLTETSFPLVVPSVLTFVGVFVPLEVALVADVLDACWLELPLVFKDLKWDQNAIWNHRLLEFKTFNRLSEGKRKERMLFRG